MGSVNVEGKLIAKQRTNDFGLILKPNNLVIPTRDIGKGFIIGRSAIIPDDNNTYIAGNCVFVLQLEEKSNADFINAYLNASIARKEMRKNIMGSAQLMIRKNAIIDFPVLIPSLPEQEKIASFLTSLDNRINEQEKVLEELKSEKQGYMQRILG